MCVEDRDGVRAPRVVRLAVDEVVPCLAVAVQRAHTVATEGDILTTKEPG